MQYNYPQTRTPRTPSRLSNCGEMVAESVLEQLEEELMLEEELDLQQSRMQSPGGRTLLVGMKLNVTCREMLAWTIVDLARPGDRIVAFHVSAFPLHSGSNGNLTQCYCTTIYNSNAAIQSDPHDSLTPPQLELRCGILRLCASSSSLFKHP